MNIGFLLVGFFFFLFLFEAAFRVYFFFITLVSGSVYFGRVSLGGFSGGPGHIFLRGAPLCRVSGRYNLFER